MPVKSKLTKLDGTSKNPISDIETLAKIAKALGHPARIQIIQTLLNRQTCIGCDIVEEIGLAASTTSEHLRILKDAGLIIGEIMHPRVCYSLDPKAVGPLLDFLKFIEAADVPGLQG
ncbi:MAG: metalloregulator ArsR/SmtB family transcription factor [Rhodospirillales bacterium]|jgi:ArsR family transcriptional regulator, arsenate/arsenite/antimonite-responsive transcriptional repressor|nr:metalloregulator ArsR/SmtB family transcription factor [Rhodospirillales bacterium]